MGNGGPVRFRPASRRSWVLAYATQFDNYDANHPGPAAGFTVYGATKDALLPRATATPPNAGDGAINVVPSDIRDLVRRGM